MRGGFLTHLIVKKSADVALSQRVEQWTRLRFFVDNGHGQSELMHKLVLAYLTNVEAVLGDALIDILMAGASASLRAFKLKLT